MSVFDPATLQGQTMRGDWLVFLAASVVVAAVVYACILSALLLWRRRSEALPPQFSGNGPLEIAGAAVSLLLVAGLFWVTYRREMPVDAVAAHPSHVVDVIAFRWSWEFDYPANGIHIVGTPAVMVTSSAPISACRLAASILGPGRTSLAPTKGAA